MKAGRYQMPVDVLREREEDITDLGFASDSNSQSVWSCR